MGRFDQDWCDALAKAAGQSALPGALERVLYVVTDTEEGKVAFNLANEDGSVVASAGKFPRGVKADVTVTAKEAVLSDLWSGTRTRDQAFMAGDLKIEGHYAVWLDHLVPAFSESPWAEAWSASS